MNQVCEWVIEKEPKVDKDGKMITPGVGHFEVKEKTIIVEKEVYEAVLRNSVRVNDLEEENNKLKQVINDAGIIKCCKCGEYHNRHYVCWHCGYDYTASKELDK